MTQQRQYTRAQVAKEGLMILNDVVYDVKPFESQHPGGDYLLSDRRGMDVTLDMEDFHSHSRNAYEMLEKFRVGTLHPDEVEAKEVEKVKGATKNKEDRPSTVDRYRAELQKELGDRSDKLIDFSKPIIEQAMKLGKYYDMYCHVPVQLSKTAPFFANPLIEWTTHTPWYYVPVFWVPIIIIMMYLGCQELSTAAICITFAIGFCVWIIAEYSIHRWLFHMIPESEAAARFHFTVHGSHHLMPMDKDRLVFPPLVAFVFVYLPLYPLIVKLIGFAVSSVLASGILVSYVLYDLTHYYIHHGTVIGPFKYLKKIHTHHHFKEPNYNFGISLHGKVVDYIMGTHREADFVETKY